jgi:hypothetical protein
MAAAIACGAFAVAAVAADASDTLYFVNPPIVTGVTQITPESVTLSGYVDTGGAPGGTYSLSPGATLQWGDGLNVVNTTAANETFSTEGLPANGSDTNVLISGGTPGVIANGSEDDFSNVVFEYDTLKDYTASGNVPGPDTQNALEVDVPTTGGGFSPVSVSVGAFGIAAQNATANTPLNSNTQYVYWISDQPGATDSAQSVNTFNPKAPGAATAVNPTYQCLPDAYIAANTYLSTFTSTTKVAGGVTSPGGPKQTVPQAGIEGPCTYYYGNVSGEDDYTSPTGTFKTAAIGKLSISSVAKVVSRKAYVPITNKSVWKSSGTLELDNANGDELATGTFGLGPGKSGTFKLKLTKAGAKAARKNQSGDLTLTSNWGQPTVTKKIELKGKKPVVK